MKVLLTGATGTIGGAILSSLATAGHEVNILVRSASKAQSLVTKFGPNVIVHELDPSQAPYSQFYTAAKGFSNIIHSGFLNSAADAELETQVIAALVVAANENSLTGPVNLLVTTGALCQGQSFQLAGEDEATNANCLDIVKIRVPHEELVINSNSETLHASIIRPVCIYGGSHVDTYFKAVKAHGKIVVPHGNGTVSYIHKDDVGELFRLVLENSGTGYFTVSEGLGPNLDQVIELAKSITGVQEVQIVDNVWEHIHSYGFYLFELSLTSILDAKRGRELYGFQPKHNFLRDAAATLKLD